MLEIDPETVRRIRKWKDQCLLRIVEVDDLDLATGMLELFRRVALAEPPDGYSLNFVSEVMSTPDGPMVLMDAKVLGNSGLDRMLARLEQISADLGLRHARLEVPASGRSVEELPQLDLAIIGSVLPLPVNARTPDVLPQSWLSAASGWMKESRYEPLVARVASVDVDLDWASLDTYIGSSGRWGFRVSGGSVGGGIRSVAGVMPINTRLALMAGGRTYSHHDLAGEARRITLTLRSCAPEASYAYAHPVANVLRFGSGPVDLPGRPSDYPGGISGYFSYLSDVQVLDAFWYQVLGPGHMARIGSLPGGRDLGGGKVELTLGDFDDWLDPEKARLLQDRGRELLEPCFIDRPVGRALICERRAARGGA